MNIEKNIIDGKGRRVIIPLVSVMLVVSIAIGAIVGINHKLNENHSEDHIAISTTTKTIASVCTVTDHKKMCVDTMSGLANNQNANPLEYLTAAITTTIQQLKVAMGTPTEIGKVVQDTVQKMAVQDCHSLLQDAVLELQTSFSIVGQIKSQSIASRQNDLKSWLSAVISYQDTCVDGFTTPELRNRISNALQNSTRLTNNALAIVNSFSEILKKLRIPIVSDIADNAFKQLGRRNGNQVDDGSKDGGFPDWVPSEDKNLLGDQNTPQPNEPQPNAPQPNEPQPNEPQPNDPQPNDPQPSAPQPNEPQSNEPQPNAVVAKDGSSQYKTINDALAAYPKDLKGRYIIYVKAGVYDEYITITKKQINIYMYGDGPEKTIITGNKSFATGVSTYRTASFSVMGKGFIGKSMGFQNTAGPQGHQAVALRVQADMSVFYNCRMDGYQDTLYVQTHRQFYRNCIISGTIDFIFGDAAAVLQNCLIIVRQPMENQKNIVTAQGRSQNQQATGIVIQNCKIVPDQKLKASKFKTPTYLGRPWKMYSRTIIMETHLAEFIQPEGWLPWSGTFALDTLYYREYANRGPGASTDKRVDWKGYGVIKSADEALSFTTDKFIQGGEWLTTVDTPYYLGLKN